MEDAAHVRIAKGTAEPGRNVRRKAGLNRQGWGMFGVLLAYKMAERGATMIEVPAHHGSQTRTASTRRVSSAPAAAMTRLPIPTRRS
jgi:hypothetical protein